MIAGKALRDGCRELVIDARWMSTGVGRYAFNLVRALKACDPSLPLHVLTGSKDVERLRPYCDRLSAVDVRMYSLREQIAVPRAVRARAVLHATHYNAPLLHRGPLLVTLPDVTPLLKSAYCASWQSRLCAWPMLRAIALRADHIFTVSQYSRERLVERLHIPPERITVAYNGADPEFHPVEPAVAREELRRELGLTAPFLLYVGNLRPHKNVSRLLRSFALLRGRGHRDHSLVILGDGRRARLSLKEDAHTLGVAECVKFVPAVTQRVMRTLYCAADMLVLPSFEEGFGFPVLEAMACGIPVACSRVAALPEVGGDAVMYFDPHSVEDMAGAISRVLDAPDLQKALGRRGLARATAFTWQASARNHCAIYRRFVQ